MYELLFCLLVIVSIDLNYRDEFGVFFYDISDDLPNMFIRVSWGLLQYMNSILGVWHVCDAKSKSFFPWFTLRFSLCLYPPPPPCASYYLFFLCLSCFIFFLYSSFSSFSIFFSSFSFLSSISLSFFFRRREGRVLDKAETQDRKIQSIIMFLTSLVKPCVFE